MWPFTRKIPEPVFDLKASQIGALMSLRLLNMPQWQRREFEKAAREGYQQNPIVHACVSLAARAAASVPLYTMRGDAEAELPELAALLERPSPLPGSGEAFRIATLSDLMLAGEFFAERVDLGDKPKELYRWRPDKVAVLPGKDGMPAGYTYRDAGGEKKIDVDYAKGKAPVLHVKGYNPIDEWRGMPSIDPAAFAVDMHTGALRWNNALLNNGAQPSGALVFAPKEGNQSLSEDQWTRLKRELDEKFSGQRNAGKPLLLDGGLDWREMGFSPRDMNFGEGLNSSARLIALAFGVPPLILGIPGDNTFANYEEANKAFYRQTVLPLLGQWCRAMSWWLGPAFGGDVSIAPDTDDLEVFADERAEQWDRIEKSTVLTVNEKRERMDLEPVEGGDVILVASSLVPLEVAGQPPEDGQDAADIGGDGEEDVSE
jgi:HK97 family phage portal protein